MASSDASYPGIERARKAIPSRFHDLTWLLDSQVMEKALDIPTDATDACIVVLDAQGNIVAQIFGDVSPPRRSDADFRELRGHPGNPDRVRAVRL